MRKNCVLVFSFTFEPVTHLRSEVRGRTKQRSGALCGFAVGELEGRVGFVHSMMHALVGSCVYLDPQRRIGLSVDESVW